MIWLFKEEQDGKTVMSPTALALLCGIKVEDVDTSWQAVEDLPAEWMKAARRRTREAGSRVNSNNVVDILRYWVRKELGKDVVEEYPQVYIP